ncbi:hypothetical protein F4678DRAFT_434788 [Xylaria arbuscula]|nr:hypothetical protein F4678DRAFT_434788 [Xylaria arbuscula]
MEGSVYIDARSQPPADDGPEEGMLPYPESENLSLTSIQPTPYEQHDQYGTDFDLESTDGKSVDIISTYSSETETVFSQNVDSVVTGPTGSAPSCMGRKDNGKETITVSSFDGSVTFDLKRSSDTPRRPDSSLQTICINRGDDGADPTGNQFGDIVITPSMNSSLNWGDVLENVTDFADDQSSVNVPDSVREGIDRFVADLSFGVVSSTSGSDLGCDLFPAHTTNVATISAVAEDGGSLEYTKIYYKHGLNMLSSRQMKELLSPENLRDVCTFCQQCPSGIFAYLSPSIAQAKPQHNPAIASRLEVVNYLLEMMTKVLNGAALKIKCWVRGPPPVDTASLRFGLDKRIVLHNLESGEPITFVCCEETFPSPDWAKKAADAFLEGASPWAAAGLTFEQVDRNMPAHFRIAFSLFPKSLDCSVLAQAFFPGTTQPEERTLWVYLLAFHPQYIGSMAGYMGHEAGHIGGSRHGFDEHILPDGSEIPELKSVTMGADNPRSVMNYHDNPADYIVQPEDIRDIRDMQEYAEDEYKEYKVLKVKPKSQVYPLTLSFEFVVNYLLSKVRES